VKSFSGKTALLPGITAHPTPGHTLVIAMWRQRREHRVLGRYCSLCFGAISKPEITVAYDVDANAAAAQRKTVCESGSIPIAGAHLPFPALDTFGQQIKVMPGCQWITAGVNSKGFIAM